MRHMLTYALFFFLMIRRPPRSTLFPYHDALPICLRRRRRDLLSGRAVHRHAPRSLRAGEELGHRHGRSEADRSLGAVLVPVKVAAGAAQGVVLDDHAEIRARRALLVAGDEGRLEAADTGLD